LVDGKTRHAPIAQCCVDPVKAATSGTDAVAKRMLLHGIASLKPLLTCKLHIRSIGRPMTFEDHQYLRLNSTATIGTSPLAA
jgi:hypothetical protein